MTTLRTLGAPCAAVLFALCGCSEGPAELRAAPSDAATVVPRSSPGSSSRLQRPTPLSDEGVQPGRRAIETPPPPRQLLFGPPSFVHLAPRATKPVLPAPYPAPVDELHAQLAPFLAEHDLEIEGPVELHEPPVERLRALPETPLPDVVRKQLDGIRRRFVGSGRALRDDLKVQQVLQWTDELLRIEIPQAGADPLHAYVSHQPEWSSMPYDDVRCLFLHDPATDEITAKPILFSGRWLSDEGPRPSWADLEGDGRPELVYRDYDHNGTVVNYDQRVYLAIGDDLSLREVFRHTRHNHETLIDHEWIEVFSRPLRARDGDELCLLVERWSKELYTTYVERPRPAHLYRWSESDFTWTSLIADEE